VGAGGERVLVVLYLRAPTVSQQFGLRYAKRLQAGHGTARIAEGLCRWPSSAFQGRLLTGRKLDEGGCVVAGMGPFQRVVRPGTGLKEAGKGKTASGGDRPRARAGPGLPGGAPDPLRPWYRPAQGATDLGAGHRTTGTANIAVGGIGFRARAPH